MKKADQVKDLNSLSAALESATDPEVIKILEAQIKPIVSKLNKNKMNAVKKTYNGVVYDSTREAMFAELLDANGIPFARQVFMTVLDGFAIHDDQIRPERLKVDFFVAGAYIIDVKGMITDMFKIKWKLLKFKYGEDYEYFTPSTDKEVREVISYIKKELSI